MITVRGMTPSLLFALLSSHSVDAFIVQPSFVASAAPTASTTYSSASRQSSRLHLMDFFNEGKKALVRKLAGDYDQQAVRARLDSMIRDSPVLMLTFET